MRVKNAPKYEQSIENFMEEDILRFHGINPIYGPTESSGKRMSHSSLWCQPEDEHVWSAVLVSHDWCFSPAGGESFWHGLGPLRPVEGKSKGDNIKALRVITFILGVEFR